MSIRDLAAATGTSRSSVWRFEREELTRIDLTDMGGWFAVVGLDLSLKAYPAGDPVRDRAHLALLGRFRARLHPRLRWRAEVPLPLEGDLRAWDAVVSGPGDAPWRLRVEAETKLADGQALERRLGLKVRDDPAGLVVLLASDTTSNRGAIRAFRDGLRELLPLDTRAILAALGDGHEPTGNGIVIL